MGLAEIHAQIKNRQRIVQKYGKYGRNSSKYGRNYGKYEKYGNYGKYGRGGGPAKEENVLMKVHLWNALFLNPAHLVTFLFGVRILALLNEL